MGAYALAHYGSSDIRLHPKVIVVHYTCGSTYENAHATFASDAPNMGVKPGVVSQFVIAKDGTVYQQIPLSYEGRHTVGLNYVALGIECVQEGRSSDAQAVSQIMHRRAQLRSLVALIRWLRYRYDISLSNVIGHGMANDSPYFKDLKGWKNDHSDWQRPEIELLRAKLK
jgi:N-acetyl-anhydromuramyl-L-alanine amidase AmpD